MQLQLVLVRHWRHHVVLWRVRLRWHQRLAQSLLSNSALERGKRGRIVCLQPLLPYRILLLVDHQASGRWCVRRCCQDA